MPPSDPSARKPSVLLSYSHKDERWKDLLKPHLAALEKAGLLASWDDRRLEGGADWFEDIQEAMAEAGVAVLLISADFLSSQFILGEEVPRLAERYAPDRALMAGEGADLATCRRGSPRSECRSGSRGCEAPTRLECRRDASGPRPCKPPDRGFG